MHPYFLQNSLPHRLAGAHRYRHNRRHRHTNAPGVHFQCTLAEDKIDSSTFVTNEGIDISKSSHHSKIAIKTKAKFYTLTGTVFNKCGKRKQHCTNKN